MLLQMRFKGKRATGATGFASAPRDEKNRRFVVLPEERK